MIHQEQADVQQVLDIDEIAHLLTVLEVGIVRAEQFHFSGFIYLVVGVKNHRRHAALVVFVGAIDIEKLQPRPEKRLFLLLQRPDIELVLRIAVGIQRLELRDL